MTTTPKPKTWPVAEIFGPTIQGEGMLQGIPCHFVRFGGCDFRCEWCDTPHAVLPHAVRANPRLSMDRIVKDVCALTRGPQWIVFSGGNPALHDLQHLVDALHSYGFKIAVETQGTRWKNWITCCDSICVSPKPPSSGMDTVSNRRAFEDFMAYACPSRSPHLFLKVVVFDASDYEWARTVHKKFPGVPFFLSTGNDAGKTVGNPSRVDERTSEQVKLDLLARSRLLVNRIMVDPEMAAVRVQSQYHVLIWGNELGR